VFNPLNFHAEIAAALGVWPFGIPADVDAAAFFKQRCETPGTVHDTRNR
jgi:hypothetical protein